MKDKEVCSEIIDLIKNNENWERFSKYWERGWRIHHKFSYVDVSFIRSNNLTLFILKKIPSEVFKIFKSIKSNPSPLLLFF